jgi:hypothetical protein
MTPLNGLNPTKKLKLKSLKPNKKKLKNFTSQSSPESTKKQEDNQEVCQVECQEVVECPLTLILLNLPIWEEREDNKVQLLMMLIDVA